MPNEQTSASIAKIASKILRNEQRIKAGDTDACAILRGVSVAELTSLAASALTQTRDKRR